jgi:hypothetical protein
LGRGRAKIFALCAALKYDVITGSLANTFLGGAEMSSRALSRFLRAEKKEERVHYSNENIFVAHNACRQQKCRCSNFHLVYIFIVIAWMSYAQTH